MPFEVKSCEDVCFRCGKVVYQVEKMGPLNGVCFHKSCFRCVVCLKHLTLRTLYSNQVSQDDKEVYCRKHVALAESFTIDHRALSIQAALTAQHAFDVNHRSGLNNPAQRGPESGKSTGIDKNTVSIRAVLEQANQREARQQHVKAIMQHYKMSHNFDADALFIRNFINAQLLAKGYKPDDFEKHGFPHLIESRKRELLYFEQHKLESIHREEEGRLMKDFMLERAQVDQAVDREIEEEWEIRLRELTAKFENSQKARAARSGHSNIDEEKRTLESTLKQKGMRKRQALTMRLKKTEQERTAQMVRKHSEQMLSLRKRVEDEVNREFLGDLMNQWHQYQASRASENRSAEDQRASDAASDKKPVAQTNPSTSTMETAAFLKRSMEQSHLQPKSEPSQFLLDDSYLNYNGAHLQGSGTEMSNARPELSSSDQNGASPPIQSLFDDVKPPEPHPPSCSKRDLFLDPSVFEQLDNHVISIAQDEQQTFTELVAKLCEPCVTDLERVRAIFRWITVKDLNTIDFSSRVTATDTPMGLLRGIKYGTETYHVLFMRLCGYAGLHCVEVRGHSKSVGYEPGMHIEADSFLNTWNAVLMDGDWRLVQCNWGARHLVLVKDRQDNERRCNLSDTEKLQQNAIAGSSSSSSRNRRDKVRYQYDEHYFLTDPDQFIQEFWPFDSHWQLLETPISLEQFEQQPFVRSVFFNHSLELISERKAVFSANPRGGVQTCLKFPRELYHSLVFHAQLRFCSKELEQRFHEQYPGLQLDRFIFQAVEGNHVLFSVHLPLAGYYYLEIFVNRLTTRGSQSNSLNAATLNPIGRSSSDVGLVELIGITLNKGFFKAKLTGNCSSHGLFTLLPRTEVSLGLINRPLKAVKKSRET